MRLALENIDKNKPFGDEIDSKFISKSILRLCENVKTDSSVLKRMAEDAYEKALADNKPGVSNEGAAAGEVVLQAKELINLDESIRYRVIKRAFLDVGLKADIEKVHLLAADRMILKGVGNKVCEFPNGYRMKMNRGLLRFIAPEESFK